MRHVWFTLLIGMATVAFGDELQVPQVPCTYPDFGFAPAGINRPLFRLSQNYPRSLPSDAEIPEFFQTSMSAADWQVYLPGHWREYLLAVRDHCFEGNLDTDWRVEQNSVRAWYHMPWQHWGRLGREGLRGLTKEASIKPRQLALTQSSGGQTYAVAFYNSFASYLIGEVWKDPESPDADAVVRLNGFPHGSVIFKLLFADIPLDQVPFLTNPLTWEAYITQSFGSDDRSIRDVHLIQMDIMVKDDRVDTGWLFGTYQYNGELNRANPWENLVPVGLQWGNDPEITGNEYTNMQPSETKINPQLKQTVINPDREELPPTHLGWNGRLNGPVDNPRSSCYSCHMAAHHPYDDHQISPLFMLGTPIEVGSEEWMRWFQNLQCMEPFVEGTTPTDSSLQLAMSLRNFFDWKTNRGGGYASKPPQLCHPQQAEGESR